MLFFFSSINSSNVHFIQSAMCVMCECSKFSSVRLTSQLSFILVYILCMCVALVELLVEHVLKEIVNARKLNVNNLGVREFLTSVVVVDDDVDEALGKWF